MKKIIVFTLALIFCLFAVACGGEKEEGSSVSLDDTVKGITEKYSLTEGLTFTSSSEVLGEYLDSDLILSYYGDAFEMPDFTKISDYCVYIDESDANVIIDVGVFKLSDASYADTLINFIKARVADKREDYDEYATIDIETLDAAIVKKSGSYVYYSVSYDVEDIIKDIEAALK